MREQLTFLVIKIYVKVMAILNGILKKLNGSAGSLTFKQVNGQTQAVKFVTDDVLKSNNH